MKYSSSRKEKKYQEKHQNAKSIIQESESFKTLLANREKIEKELALMKSWPIKKKHESEEHYKYRMSVGMETWPFLTKEQVDAILNKNISRRRQFKKAMKGALLKARKDLSIACGPDFLSTEAYNYEEIHRFFAGNDHDWEEERMKRVFSEYRVPRWRNWDDDDDETPYAASPHDWNLSDATFERRLAEAVKDKYERGIKRGLTELNYSRSCLALIKDELAFKVWKFRTRALKEGLMAAALHPRRVQAWLALGGFELLDSL